MCPIMSDVHLNAVNPCRRLDVETYVLPDGTALLFDPVTEAGYPIDILSSLIWDYCDGMEALDTIANGIAALLPQMSNVSEHTHPLLYNLSKPVLLIPP